VLTGEKDAKSPHEALFFYYKENELQGMRSEGWKLIFPHNCTSIELAAPCADRTDNRQIRDTQEPVWNSMTQP